MTDDKELGVQAASSGSSNSEKGEEHFLGTFVYFLRKSSQTDGTNHQPSVQYR